MLWCYIINILGKNPRAESCVTLAVTVDDSLDVVATTKEQTQQFTLPFTTIEDECYFLFLFGLTAGLGCHAPLYKCLIVGVNIGGKVDTHWI